MTEVHQTQEWPLVTVSAILLNGLIQDFLLNKDVSELWFIKSQLSGLEMYDETVLHRESILIVFTQKIVLKGY
jgi:hypothetical protein